ncbi:MAG: response regulator [Deltaproteobacteria bacterium]|nr:response regulator [Deltaproteobacteria bacterium]
MYSILVVDDEVPVLRFVKRVFSRAREYEILVAKSTKSALRLIREKNPDITLMDIHFSTNDSTGVECVRQARAAGYTGVICMLSGDSSPELLIRAAHAGADDFIVKGPSCNLAQEVDRLLSREKSFTSEIQTSPIAKSAFLYSHGLRDSQTKLLSEYASLGYPRIKELANQTGLPEHTLWKRLSRIRDKLGVDSMTRVVHLLTAISAFGVIHTKSDE